MSQIINIPLILLSIFSFIKCDIYRDRHNGYKAVYDCLGDDRGEGSGNSIQIPEDCFDESPLRKSSKIGGSCDGNTEVSSGITKGSETL